MLSIKETIEELRERMKEPEFNSNLMDCLKTCFDYDTGDPILFYMSISINESPESEEEEMEALNSMFRMGQGEY